MPTFNSLQSTANTKKETVLTQQMINTGKFLNIEPLQTKFLPISSKLTYLGTCNTGDLFCLTHPSITEATIYIGIKGSEFD